MNLEGERIIKLYIEIDNKTPIKTELRSANAQHITLADFKSATGLSSTNYRYFFKSHIRGIGVAKEEITDNDTKLPLFRGQIFACVLTTNAIYEDIPSRHHGINNNAAGIYSEMGIPTAGTTTTGTITTDDTDSYFQTTSESDDDGLDDDDDRTSYTSYSNYRNQGGHSNSASAHYERAGRFGHLARGSNNSDDDNESSIYPSLANGSLNGRYGKMLSRCSKNEDNHSSELSDTNTAYQMHQIKSTKNQQQETVVVQLYLTKYNFLGLSVRGQTDSDGNDRIYIGDIKDDSEMAKNGRIEPGDLLLQVNDTDIVGKSIQEALQILKDAVARRGHLKLIVAKFSSSSLSHNKYHQNSSSQRSLSRRNHHRHHHIDDDEDEDDNDLLNNTDEMHPIDLHAWVAQTRAMAHNSLVHENSDVVDPLMQTTTAPIIQRNAMPNVQLQNLNATGSTTSSPSFGSGFMVDSSDCVQLAGSIAFTNQMQTVLDKDKTDSKFIVQQMQIPDSGLEIKDREWLKIKISRAFLGSGLINWLQRNVVGCQDRRHARKFASHLLKQQLIRDPISDKSFSEKCYYTFVD